MPRCTFSHSSMSSICTAWLAASESRTNAASFKKAGSRKYSNVTTHVVALVGVTRFVSIHGPYRFTMKFG